MVVMIVVIERIDVDLIVIVDWIVSLASYH
jgi:hypothetical protein